MFFPTSLAPPPFPHLNRKESAPSINTGQCSRTVTTTNWTLDWRSWRPSPGSWLLGTKRASFPQIGEQCGPSPGVLVVSSPFFFFFFLNESSGEMTGQQKFPSEPDLYICLALIHVHSVGWSHLVSPIITNDKPNDYRTSAGRIGEFPHPPRRLRPFQTPLPGPKQHK